MCFCPEGPIYLNSRTLSLCTSIKLEHCRLLAAAVCMGPEVRMRVQAQLFLSLCVCVFGPQRCSCSALRVSLPGAAWCAVLTVAGEQCYGPWQLVKDFTELSSVCVCACVCVRILAADIQAHIHSQNSQKHIFVFVNIWEWSFFFD